MKFQIRSSDGRPVPFYELDKEAAELWGKPVSTEEYASPYTSDTNWFDSIGWAIANPINYTEGWEDVKCTLWTIQSKELFRYLYAFQAMNTAIEAIKRYLRPYYNLIDLWESEGYTPHKM